MQKASYHLSPDGTPRLCQAEMRICPYGPEDSHYPSREEAQEAYELSMRCLLFSKPGVKELSLETHPEFFPTLLEAKAHPERFRTWQGFEAANAGKGFDCPHCGKSAGGPLESLYIQSTEMIYSCPHCGDLMDYVDLPITVPNVNSPTYFALEKDNISKMTWYHYTNRSNWHEDILSAKGPEWVHVGSEVAAADRSTWGGDRGYLYVIDIDSEASIADDVEQDGSDEFIVDPLQEAQVVRYLNRFEDSGSISLATRPSTLRIRGRLSLATSELLPIKTYGIEGLREEVLRREELAQERLGVPRLEATYED